MSAPSDEDFQKSSEALRADREDLAKRIAAHEDAGAAADSFLDDLAELGVELLEEGGAIALPLLEAAAVAAIQGALARRRG